jgi:hypothetical protein
MRCAVLPSTILGPFAPSESTSGEARSLVLALFRRDAFHGEAGDIADPAPDLETGGAGFAVDEDGGLGFGLGCGLRPGGCLGGHGAYFLGFV